MKKFLLYSPLLIIFLCGCVTNLPVSVADTDSLVVYVTSSDPVPQEAVSFTKLILKEKGNENGAVIEIIPSKRSDVEFLNPKPGIYSIVLENQGKIIEPPAFISKPFTIGRGAVSLFPAKLYIAGSSFALMPLNGQDQKKASSSLKSFYNFLTWTGKHFEGFGNYKPRSGLEGREYKVKVTSSPQGAKVFIDGSEWGTTPLQMPLAEGKYLVEVKKDGFGSFRQFFSIIADRDIPVTLKEVSKTEKDKNTYKLMVYPFTEPGKGTQGAYSNVIQDTLTVNFSGDKKITALDYADSGNKEGKSRFAAAEKAGADLAVSGFYQVNNDELFVSLALYDVKSERVKFAKTYTIPGGMKIFDSIDSFAREFSGAATNVLPPVGETVVQQYEEKSPEMTIYEKRLFDQDSIEERAAFLNSFSLSAGIGGFSIFQSTGGPMAYLNLSYDREFLSFLNLKGELTFGSSLLGDLPFTEFRITAGPSLVSRLHSMDLYLAVLASYGFAPDPGASGMNVSFGYPFQNIGFYLNIGAKTYMNPRSDQPPQFFDYGLKYDIFFITFNQSLNQSLLYAFNIQLYFGYGFGL